MSELGASSSADRTQSSDLGELLSEIAERVDAAASAAQGAAEAIRVEARASRARFTPASGSGPAAAERARMVEELTDTVVAHVEEIADRFGQVSAILEASTTRLAVEDRSASTAEPSPNAVGGTSRVSAGLRLLTSQMAVAGSTREEIEERLRDEFRVTNSAEVVDELLGRDFGRA